MLAAEIDLEIAHASVVYEWLMHNWQALVKSSPARSVDFAKNADVKRKRLFIKGYSNLVSF